MRRKWLFMDKPSVMVITTKGIVNKGYPILTVWHDSDDGMWQFHDGTSTDDENSMVISLSEIIDIDNSIEDLFDLPLGWVAWREYKSSKWLRRQENA